jgi:hypothetical protein
MLMFFKIKNPFWVSNVPFNAVVFEGVNENRAEASTNGAKFQFDSLGRPHPQPLSEGEGRKNRKHLS